MARRSWFGMVLLAACGDGGWSPPDAGPPLVEANLRLGAVHLTDEGELEVPEPGPTTLLRFLVHQDVDSWKTVLLMEREGGVANFKRVPSGGEYYVQVGDDWVITTATELDFRPARLGRPDVEYGEAGTELSVTLDGLSPWTNSDALILYSAGADAWSWLDQDTNLAFGATSVQDMIVDWAYTPIIRGALGDRAHVFQYSWRLAAGLEYRAVARALAVPPFNQPNGLRGGLEGTLSEAFPMTASLDLRSDELMALRPESLAPDGTLLSVIGQPGGATHGRVGYPPELVLAFDPPSGPLDLTFGAPVPSEWAIYATLLAQFSTSHLLPGTTDGGVIFAEASVTVDLDALGGQPLAPMVGPPLDLRIEDVPATVALGNVGPTPTISWLPPAVGTPTGYEVTVYRLEAFLEYEYTLIRTAATIRTTATALELPPDLLQPDETYVVKVAAIVMPGVDLTVTPLRRAFPEGRAEALTQTFYR